MSATLFPAIFFHFKQFYILHELELFSGLFVTGYGHFGQPARAVLHSRKAIFYSNAKSWDDLGRRTAIDQTTCMQYARTAVRAYVYNTFIP